MRICAIISLSALPSRNTPKGGRSLYGILSASFTTDYMENLADELALLYIKKSKQEFSNPKDIAREFVEVQEIIAKELESIRLGK